MKKIIFTLALLITIFSIQAQNVGIGTATPNASARLDVSDTNRGILIPRVALTATNAAGPVTSPATSLLVYNTATAGTAPFNVTPGYYYWDGTQWVRLKDTESPDWKLDGNTNGTLRYIGTNDNFDFPIRTNGTEKMRVTTGGNVGIGTATPVAQLHVMGTSGDANNGSLIIGPTASTNLRMGYVTGSRSWIQSHGSMPLYINELGNNTILNLAAGSVGIGTAAPAASTILDVSATNRGVRIPNVALTARNNNAPIGVGIVNSLLVYNTATSGAGVNAVTPGYYYWNGTEWVRLTDGPSNDWALLGNAGTTETVNFIGTTDAQGLTVRTNNLERFRFSGTTYQLLSIANGTAGAPAYSWNSDTDMGIFRAGVDNLGFSTNAAERMRILANGFVGIGTAAPGYLLDVAGRMRVRNGGGTSGIWFFEAADRAFVGMLDNDHIGIWGNGAGNWGVRVNVNNLAIGGANRNPTNFVIPGITGVDFYQPVEIGNDAGWNRQVYLGYWRGGDPEVSPEANSRGYVGFNGTPQNAWWRMASFGFITVSQRTHKKNIVSVSDDPNLEALVMKDIENINPSLYNFVQENENLTTEHDTRYRKHYHLGLMVDEVPDYIKDENLSGIDLYGVGVLALTGVKYHQRKIKELTQKIMDFNSEVYSSGIYQVKFNEKFKNQLKNHTPVIVITPISEIPVNYRIIEKNQEGFKIIFDNAQNITFDWIAIANIQEATTQNEISVSSNIKEKMYLSPADKQKAINCYNIPPTEKAIITK